MSEYISKMLIRNTYIHSNDKKYLIYVLKIFVIYTGK